MACCVTSGTRTVPIYFVLAVVALWVGASPASAQNDTVNIGDDFKVGFPMGITVRKNDTFAFDIELVPALDFDDDGPVRVPLTIHPGILRTLGGPWTGGMRMTFDVDAAHQPCLHRW